MSRPRLILVPLLALAAGCPSAKTPECRVGADCASGACRGDGTCVPVGSSDAGTDAGGTSSDSGLTDAGPSDAGSQGSDSGLCVPAHDGTITRARVPLAAGLRATFVIAEDAGFNTAGTTSADGGRLWDLTAAFPGDHSAVEQTQAPGSYWFANAFPTATYVGQLSDTSNLLGIFQANDSALLLLGVASPTNNYPQTEITYSPAVTVLAFPLHAGATWQTQANVSGWFQGVYYAQYTEAYSSQVDASGTLLTPYGTFDVLRVGVKLTRTVGLLQTVIRTFSFAADCFGPVASITSQNNEQNAEFTTASELKRLGP